MRARVSLQRMEGHTVGKDAVQNYYLPAPRSVTPGAARVRD